MKNAIVSIFLFVIFGCISTKNPLYTKSSVEDIQPGCEASIKSWISSHAEFPDTYVPLLFERVGISSTYHKSLEIEPLRRYTVEHTFEIRTREYAQTHTTLIFELTPDFFIQNIKYKIPGEFSIEHRIFPPDYKLWLEMYGRALTKTDSLSWTENNRPLLAQLSEKFTFNRYINPEGENLALSDSLINQINSVYRSTQH